MSALDQQPLSHLCCEIGDGASSAHLTPAVSAGWWARRAAPKWPCSPRKGRCLGQHGRPKEAGVIQGLAQKGDWFVTSISRVALL